MVVNAVSDYPLQAGGLNIRLEETERERGGQNL